MEDTAQRERRIAICRRAEWRCQRIEKEGRCFRAAPHYRMVVSEEGQCLCAQHELDRVLAKSIEQFGRREVVMTPKLRGLSAKLRDVRGSIEARAEAIGKRLDGADQDSEVASALIHGELDKIEQATKDIVDFAKEMSNGGPPLEQSGG
jgi:hypothetical protein